MDLDDSIVPSGPGFENCDILARALARVRNESQPSNVQRITAEVQAEQYESDRRRSSTLSGGRPDIDLEKIRKASVASIIADDTTTNDKPIIIRGEKPSITQRLQPAKQTNYEPVPPPCENYEHRKNTIASAPAPLDREFAWLRPITNEEAKDALLREVRKHSCWREKAVRTMEITNIECYTSLHYTLETFTETRSTSVATEPYTLGQMVDASAFQFTLDPWDVPCEPAQDFIEDAKVMELPGTTILAGCGSCDAEGIVHCFHCRGSGSDKCQGCRGTGMRAGIPHPAVYTHPMVGTFPHTKFQSDAMRGYPGGSSATMRSGGMTYGMGTPVHFMNVAGGMPPPGLGHSDLCYFCHGRGIKECSHCRGNGKRACAVCSGSGSIRSFQKLKIIFDVERSEIFHEEGGVPEKLLQNVTGELVMTECQPFVLPLRNYPVEEINDQSKRLCQIHLQKCLGTCRILQQRHVLEAVPVAKVDFQLGTKNGTFWVYGQERVCYVPKYPSKCVIL